VSSTDAPLREEAPAAAFIPAPKRTLSVVALAFGVVGLLSSLVGVGLVFALVAVILGHLGSRREPAARAIAVTGVIAGYLGLAVSVVWWIVTLAALLVPVFAVGILAGIPFFDR
jgi:hypothetical protein